MSVRSLNKVMLIGNLTRDPQLKFTPTGTAVCTFGIATNRSWVPSDGSDRQEETEFHNIVAWAKLAEICGELLHKGDKVYVDGRLRTRKWQTQEGQERVNTEIVIDNMMLLSNSRGGLSNYRGADESGTTADSVIEDMSAPAVSDGAGEEVTEDIPF